MPVSNYLIHPVHEPTCKVANLVRFYEFVTAFPRGARHLRVEEVIDNISSSYLSLTFNDTGEAILNWQYQIQWPGNYELDSFRLVYEREARNVTSHSQQVSSQQWVCC